MWGCITKDIEKKTCLKVQIPCKISTNLGTFIIWNIYNFLSLLYSEIKLGDGFMLREGLVTIFFISFVPIPSYRSCVILLLLLCVVVMAPPWGRLLLKPRKEKNGIHFDFPCL